jgi:hypothetical protein
MDEHICRIALRVVLVRKNHTFLFEDVGKKNKGSAKEKILSSNSTDRQNRITIE